jgi:hypothetical protein
MNLIIISPIFTLESMKKMNYLNKFLEELEKIYFEKYSFSKNDKKLLVLTLHQLLSNQLTLSFTETQFKLLLQKLISLISGFTENNSNSYKSDPLESQETLHTLFSI